MTSILSASSSAAAILELGRKDDWSATRFLVSSVLSASSSNVLDAIYRVFSTDKNLQIKFTEDAKKVWNLEVEGQRCHPDNAKHIALVEGIVANRERFPPEKFTIRTELPDGASIESTIFSLVGYAGDIFKRDQADKQAAFDARAAQENAKPDQGQLMLKAMAAAVEALTLENADKTAAAIPEGEAAYLLLTNGLLDFDEDYESSANLAQRDFQDTILTVMNPD